MTPRVKPTSRPLSGLRKRSRMDTPIQYHRRRDSGGLLGHIRRKCCGFVVIRLRPRLRDPIPSAGLRPLHPVH